MDTSDWQLYTYELREVSEITYYGLLANDGHPNARDIPVEFENFVQQEKNIWKELLRRR